MASIKGSMIEATELDILDMRVDTCARAALLDLARTYVRLSSWLSQLAATADYNVRADTLEQQWCLFPGSCR